MTGSELIAQERQRQIDIEGFNRKHDSYINVGDMSRAAICYIGNAFKFDTRGFWPWDSHWWKPSPPTKEGKIRDLVKAGALIAAEIDKLQLKD